MTARTTLSIDAMGGDEGPAMVVEGVAMAAAKRSDTDFLLFGKKAQIVSLLDKFPDAAAVCTVRHAEDVVLNDDKPAVALRGRRGSSMRMAIDSVKDGEAAAVISAGNTGALMAMAKFVLKTLPGIDRPAIATFFPTQRSESVMLDLGANIECDANHLVQFAVMGEVFARNVLGLKEPSVGILNVGVEDLKGNSAVKEAAAVLQDTHLPIKFHGFVEGDDIGAGTVDVIVTDGFTGNVALKTAEGTAKFFSQALRDVLTSSSRASLGALIAKPALNQLKIKLDPRRYNGAMFLGLNGICIKSHGGTDAFGFAHAIEVGYDLIANSINDSIKQDFSQLQADMLSNKQSIAGQ
ncbi:MAG: phosphate acyltransferase [Rhodospirillaceae bacterium TMED8]|nr:phosphate acyltransferase [Magnetovibrio sp.]OUT52008.1 MAG: phosphate acyltransferase [Rhodospirillaceae bacterium TMED8]